MQVQIIVESSFGNTAACAATIAAGLREAGVDVSVVAAADAPARPVCDLLLVGAPTHNRGLPQPRSRAIAARQGAESGAAGVAEWLDGLGPMAGRTVAAFDTAVPSRFSGSAAKKIAKELAARGARVTDSVSFLVAGSPPALRAGELDRAKTWGAGLAVSAGLAVG